MSSRFVRASSYRHVFADPPKAEDVYSDLNLSTTTGDQFYIKSNGKFFSVACRGGGGPVLPHPLSKPGRLGSGQPMVYHGSAVFDTAWNPFNDNMLATAGDDGTVKIWNIPDDGLTEKLSDAVQTLVGHAKPVTLLDFHPVANNVLASAAKDPSVKIWDVEKGTDNITLDAFGGLIQDMSWNYNGDLLATSSKDKLLRVWDPRANSATGEVQPHEGVKAFNLTWLGDSGRIVTVGFTRQSKREIKFWDSRSLDTPVHVHELDQAAGVLMPFYDPDTKLLFIAGKGDGNIRYFEVQDDAPYVYPLSEYRTSSTSAKGVAMCPKRSCNPLKCEIARLLKLTSTGTVEPLSFIVPRKSESFQEDIFPDTYAGEPALTAEQWFGNESAAPKTMSMDPAKNGGRTAPPASFSPVAQSPKKAAAGGGASGSAGAGGASGKSVAELEAELAAANARIAALEKENAELKAAASS